MKKPPRALLLSLPVVVLVSACGTTGSTSWSDLQRQFRDAEAAATVEAPPPEELRTPDAPVELVEIPEPVTLSLDPVSYERAPVIAEMRRLWIRDPEMLLDTLATASVVPGAPPLSFLLAIAHAETNGRPLLVSEAGAVGLAQATPAAFLQEKQEGPLFVTSRYVEGMRAYILKKPLGDAVAIASAALGERRASPDQVPALLAEARRLSRVGVDDVRSLAPWYDGDLEAALERDHRRNEGVLDEVERVIATGDRKRIEEMRDAVRRDYRALMDVQRSNWKQYERELTAKRDEILIEKFGADGKSLRGELAYNAGEFLAETFDARFSPSGAAEFLVRHLDRKITEAATIRPERDSTSLAAALYNGGAHNVLRMEAGLIESLPETDRYAEKVPNTRRRIEEAMAATLPAPSEGEGGVARR